MLLTDIIPIGLIAFVLSLLLTLVLDFRTFRTAPWRTVCQFAARFLGLWWAMTAIALLFKTRTFFLNNPGSPFAHVNLLPFKTITAYLGSQNWLQLLGNAFILLPFPVLLAVNFPRMKTHTYYWVVFGVTALIEPVQLLVNLFAGSPVNAIDIDDFLLNALGCLLGLAVAHLFKHLTRKKATRQIV